MGRAFEVRKASMAKTAAAKTKVYSRFGKEIYLAAKAGVPDPEMNISLKRIMDKAKKAQVPADIIKRAIDRASSGANDDYTSTRYEGFGPGASTIIVDCLTDNVNRTVSEVRNCFTKTKNKMGVGGSVAHMYNQWSIVSFTGLNEEETLEALLMADIEIIDLEEEEGVVTVYGAPTDLYKIKTTLEEAKADINIEIDEISMIPMNYTTLEGEELENFQRLLDMLDEIDDVQEVYHNVQLD
jgi:YebC/PmpR family DNA-binding regulatory protein